MFNFFLLFFFSFLFIQVSYPGALSQKGIRQMHPKFFRVGASIFLFILRAKLSWGSSDLKPYIIDGTDVPPGKYPWVALIKVNGGGSCSGSLISNDTILCAAHCFSETRLGTAYIGATDM